MNLPRISYERNFAQVWINRVCLYYSYTILVAFQVRGERPVVRQNVWSRKTGQHLNDIDRGRDDLEAVRRRVDETTFNWRFGLEAVPAMQEPLPVDCLRMDPGALADWLADQDRGIEEQMIRRMYEREIKGE